jgi:hypothetical protein
MSGGYESCRTSPFHPQTIPSATSESGRGEKPSTQDGNQALRRIDAYAADLVGFSPSDTSISSGKKIEKNQKNFFFTSFFLFAGTKMSC